MNNFYITDDLKLRKIYGYKSFWSFEAPIKSMFSTNLGGTEYLLVVVGDKLYYFLGDEIKDESNWDDVEPTLIGTIGTRDVSFFTFDKKVYILSGKYQSWDGTILEEVEGYTPLVFINTPPAGGGLIYDEINMLNPKKKQSFNGDGTSTVYKLAQKGLDEVISVSVNGNVYREVAIPQFPDEYSVDYANGTITFNVAPSSGNDNVEVCWSKDDNDRHLIENMRFGTIFGGDIDTRVFVYGNQECPNRTYFSGIADGLPSAEYFPATAQVDIGPSNFTLTDLTRQYDRLLATTNKPEAYYLTIGTEQLPVTLGDQQTTRYVPSVSTFPLNEAHGNMALGQGQLIDNYPVTMDKNCVTLWKATNVRDEKNAENISQKINLDLEPLNMNAMKTLDFQFKSQLWFGYNNKIYIYNYLNKTFSRLSLPDTFNCYSTLDKFVYMGLNDGRVVKWGEEFSTFDEQTIRAHWEMNFSDFGTAYLRKTMSKLWVSMQPQGLSSAVIGYTSNLKESTSTKRIEYKIQALDDVDFSDFSFQISYNPQPFRLKLKAKKFTNLKIIIDNEEETDCTILQLSLKVDSFGESK